MASLCRLRTFYSRSFPSMTQRTVPSSVYRVFLQHCSAVHRCNINRTLFSSSISTHQAQAKLCNQSISLEDYFLDLSRLKLITENVSLMDQKSPIINLEAEHLYAYHVVKNNSAYNQTVNRLIMMSCISSRDYSYKWPNNLADFLLEPKDMPQYDEDLRALGDILQTMGFNEIIAFQKYLLQLIPYSEDESEWKKMFLESNLFKVWTRLDEVASRLFEESSLNESLYPAMAISSLWYELGLLAQVRFNRVFIYKLLNYNQDLDKLPFLHLMYSLSVARSIESNLVESLITTTIAYLNKNDDLNIEELSLVAMGFFKTQTKMSYFLLSQFVPKSTNLLKETYNKPLSIPVTMLIKCIRYAVNRKNCKFRPLRENLKTFADVIIEHSCKPLECNICLTQFVKLLNSSYLFNYRQQYNFAFERVFSNTKDFRIKDVDRIFHCFARKYFRFPILKLKYFEAELMKHEEKEFFPYYVYNIANHLLKLQYCPDDLVKLCCNQEFLSASIDSFKTQPFNSLLIAETILRLTTNRQILTSQQLQDLNKCQMECFKDAVNNSQKQIYMLNFCHLMRAIFGDRFRLMNMFPFFTFPYLIILNDTMAHFIRKPASFVNIFDNANPFEADYLRANLFHNCTAFIPLSSRDFYFTDIKNEFVQLQKRLLQVLGFKVIFLEQKNYPFFVHPDYAKNLSPEELRRYREKLLHIEAHDALKQPTSESRVLRNFNTTNYYGNKETF